MGKALPGSPVGATLGEGAGVFCPDLTGGLVRVEGVDFLERRGTGFRLGINAIKKCPPSSSARDGSHSGV